MKIFAETTVNEYKHPTRISSNIQAQILGITNNKGKTIGEVIAELEKRNQEKLTQFPATSDEKTKRMIQILNRKEILNWLTNLPIKEHGYELTKQEFWDAIKIRYNWPLDRIPSQCFCGESFNVTCSILQERWFRHVKTQGRTRYNFRAIGWSMHRCKKGSNSSGSQ